MGEEERLIFLSKILYLCMNVLKEKQSTEITGIDRGRHLTECLKFEESACAAFSLHSGLFRIVA